MKRMTPKQKELCSRIKQRIIAKFDSGNLNDKHSLAKLIFGKDDTDIKRLLHELPFYRILAGPYRE